MSSALHFRKLSVKIRKMLVAKPSFFLQHRALKSSHCNNNNKTVSEILTVQKFKNFSSAALLSLAALPLTSQAASFDFDKFSVEWDTVFTAGVQYRIQNPMKKISRGNNGLDGSMDDLPGLLDNAFIINSNDGNNNFRKGFTAQRVSVLTEADFNFGDWGVFTRAKVWYDFRYGQAPKMNERSWAENNSNPVFGGANGNDTSYGQFGPAARNYSESGSKMLDLFWYGTVTFFDHDFSLRVGRQVISWGEAMLSGGGINMATSHVDAHIRNQPGLEIKELFLPSNAIYLQTSLTDSIELEAFLQLEWQPAFIDPSGTYFSEFDSIGSGGNKFMFLSGTEDRVLGKELKLFDMLADDYVEGQGGRARTFKDFSNEFHGGTDLEDWTPSQAEIDRVNTLSSGRLSFANGNQLKTYAKDLDDLLTFLPTTCDQSSGRIAQQRCTGLVPHKVRVDRAKDTGQFGLALKFFLDNGDEAGLYYVNYHEKIPNWVLPIDAIEDMAPVIDLLVNVADRDCYMRGDCDIGMNTDGLNSEGGFGGIADLDGSKLSMKQINALLLFLSALPEDQGTIADITADLVADPWKVLGDNPSPTMNFIADKIANDPLLRAIVTSQAQNGADGFLGQFGMGKDTVVRSVNYRLQYAEDVHMLGATYSTILGSANVATEITYRQNTPLMLADIPRTPKRFQLINWHVNMLQVFEPVSLWGRNLWDFSTLVAEVLTWYVPGATAYDKGKGPDSMQKNLETNRLAVQNSPKGVGASVFWSLEYNNVFTGWDLMVPVYANYGVYGAMFNSGYRDGQGTFATGLTFKHTTGLELGLGVTTFFGKTDDIFQILTQDRDNVTAHFKYGF